jgi:uncharacterized RDD family membrane protein YckC
LLDTFHEIETPEGVEFRLRVAGPVVRSLAWGVDFLIRAGIYVVLGIALSLMGKFGMGLLLILLFAIEWLYPVLFEVYRHGATPGKRSLGLCVVHDDGTPVDWSASLLRNLLRFVDFLPFLYGFGLASMLIRADSKRLGDLAAGTRVVYREHVRQTCATPDVQAVPPRIALQLDEQRAVIDFAGRLDQLSEERARELAVIIAPLVTRPRGDAVVSLAGAANWLLGKPG